MLADDHCRASIKPKSDPRFGEGKQNSGRGGSKFTGRNVRQMGRDKLGSRGGMEKAMMKARLSKL